MDNSTEAVLNEPRLSQEVNILNSESQIQQSDINLELEKIKNIQLSQIESYLNADPKKLVSPTASNE